MKSLEILRSCLQGLTKWMSLYFLHLNGSKMEIILFGSAAATAVFKTELKFEPNMRFSL